VRAERRFAVYLLRCRDGSLYAGISDRLAARVAAHQAGTAARYTRSRRPVALVWCRTRQTGPDARRLEWALKREPREAKLRLIGGDDSVWRCLRRRVLGP
jgi:putative endonuclease